MVAVLDDHDIGFAKECEHRGLPLGEYLDSPVGLPRSLHLDFERCFADLTTKRTDIWLELGMLLRLPAFGLVGLAYLTSPSLRHVMRMCTEFCGITCSIGSQDHVVTEEWEGARLDVAQVPPELRDFTVVRDLATTIVCLNDFWTGAFPLKEIAVSSEQAWTIDTFRKFDLPVQVRGSDAHVLWDSQDASKPLFNGNLQYHNYYIDECRKLRGADSFADPFLERVKTSIETALVIAADDLSLERIAKDLCISARTLQRRLGDRDISFRAICDIARMKVAENLLGNASISVADIAFRLGYSEPASFHHAFKRWRGKSPKAYRHALSSTKPTAGGVS